MVQFKKLNSFFQENFQVLKKMFVIIVCILLVFTLIFTLYSNYSMSKKLAKLENELQSIRPDIEKYKQDNEKISTELANFDDFKLKVLTSLAIANLKLDQYSKAVFNAADSAKGFARIDTSTGMFFLILDQVEALTDGYKLYFRIGNPQNCVYSGYNIKIRWGQKYNEQDTTISKEEWDKSLQSEDLTFQDLLIPGKWTSFDITLSSAKKEEIEYVEIKVQAERISMQKSE